MVLGSNPLAVTLTYLSLFELYIIFRFTIAFPDNCVLARPVNLVKYAIFYRGKCFVIISFV